MDLQGFSFGLIAAVAGIIIVFIFVVAALRRYKRCPSDRIMVVYGKTGKGESSRCIHGGAAFVWPVIQDFSFLDLTPISIEINLTNALSKQNIRVDVPSRFTVGISTDTDTMTNAAERLLGLTQTDISNLAKDIIFGQLRLVVATMDIEEINSNRDKFLAAVSSNVEQELKKIGLKLINVNVTDINDESGYIDALGKEAAAQAINDAKKTVAEKNRDGEIGQKQAHQDQRVKVADAESLALIGEKEAEQRQRTEVANANADAEIGEKVADQKKRTQTAEANARAVEGENKAEIEIANSNATRDIAKAQAKQKSTAAEKISDAKALEEGYAAEKTAEDARALRDKAAQTANIVVPAEIDKQKIEIDAEAQAEKIRREAKGQADATFMNMEAQAKGIFEIYSKQAEGLEKIVKAAGGNPNAAFTLMLMDKLPEIVKMQTEAISNLKIDKITVWENGNNGNGGNATSNFVQGLFGSMPQLNDILSMAGMELPSALIKKTEPVAKKPGDENFEEVKEEK